MKSIKEKAEERAPYTKTDSWGKIKAAINAQTSFGAGANYVLDEIEKCVKSSSNSRLKIDTIKQIIEQLKK